MTKYNSALIIDDQIDQIDLLTQYLSLQGIESNGSTNFSTFQAQYEKQNPDLIILDISMPDHDAFEYIKWLSEHNSQADIIFITGFGPEVMDVAVAMAKGQRLNVLAHLHKPFSYQTLEACL